MQIIKIDPEHPSSKAIKIAAGIMKKGGVIIYPTDTIYGIGVSALDQSAIDKVYKIKERPSAKPLSIIVGNVGMAKKYCDIGRMQEEIFSTLFPGAFTLIFLEKIANKNKVLTAHDGTLSVRVPDYKITARLIGELKIPFTATSANISGLPGSGNISDVLKQLENKKNLIDLVLDAGVLPKKNPSVIIDLTDIKPKIIRK